MTTGIHDALFKTTFSQIEHATGELQAILPPALSAHIDFATLAELVAREVGKDVEEAIATTADMLRAEGRSEGRIEGQREMLLPQLSKRFGVPDDAAARVNAAGPADLDAWSDRVLTAATLAGVLGDG